MLFHVSVLRCVQSDIQRFQVRTYSASGTIIRNFLLEEYCLPPSICGSARLSNYKKIETGFENVNQTREDSVRTCSQYVILSYLPESSSHVSRLPVLRWKSQNCRNTARFHTSIFVKEKLKQWNGPTHHFLYPSVISTYHADAVPSQHNSPSHFTWYAHHEKRIPCKQYHAQVKWPRAPFIYPHHILIWHDGDE